MRGKRGNLRLIALFTTICFLLSIAAPFSLPGQVLAAEQATIYPASEMVSKAVKFINDKYQAGEKIDGYTAYVLTLAGEDLTGEKWTRNGKTLKREIEELADLLDNSNSLITYITATQNNDGSFGPYANEYGTKAPLQALAAVKDDLMVGTAVYDQVKTAIANAVSYFQHKYQDGSITYDNNGWNFDYRCIAALSDAGEDLAVGEWVYNGTSLKEIVIASADATTAAITVDPTVKDAVYLAKELTALYAVAPDSDNIGQLADAIVNKQADNGSFGTNIYDHVTVLTALGKTGQLSGINQTKALEYINSFKQAHKDSWGFDAGAAWGSTWGGSFHEEADLTAQVITALSYFNGADTPGSDVYRSIQDGLTYLRDIQDADTAAIPAEGDSTFATAETLIALKALGKTYNDYAGDASPWVKKSRTKTIAQCLLALSKWGETDRVNKLADLLIARHSQNGFDNSVFSDIWAYIALGEADKISNLNIGDTKTYILSKQAEDGSWGETFDQYYPDLMSTAQAIRALSYLPGARNDTQIQVAIEKGLAYLEGLQQDNGGVYAQYGDPAVDNSETIVTLRQLGQDPEGVDWTKTINGKNVNPVSYLMTDTMNEDGSFGSVKNVFAATEALSAYILQTNVDMIATVKNGVKYLADQYSSDNDRHMYQQYGGYKAAQVLTLAGEDLTADTWQKDGKTLEARIREDAAALTEQSSVTDIAKTLIGLCGLRSQNLSERSRLIALIAAKQNSEGNFADGAIYNEMLPYLALTIAEGWSLLTPEKQAKAKEWLINAQTKTGQGKGSWQHQWGVDTVSTAQAVVVLSSFADAKTVGSATYQAVSDGLAWLKSKQDNTGKINVPFDDPVVDTAETVLAVLAAGENPKGAEWTKDGNNLLDYLLLRANQNDDGSIGDKDSFSGNVGSTVPALLALLKYNQTFGWIDFGSVQDVGIDGDNKGNPPVPPSKDEYKVNIAVVGQNGELLFGPGSVTVSKTDKWGLTALGALHATGLSYSDDSGFVKSIAGQANSGMNGWMYKVNNTVPMVLACDKKVNEGDQVIWWYSKDMNSTGPTWNDLLQAPLSSRMINQDLPAGLQASPEALETLDKVNQLLNIKEDIVHLGVLGEVAKAVVVVGDDKPMARAEIAALKKELAQNVVNLTQKVKADQGATIADTRGEVGLSVPANALNRSVEISVKEIIPASVAEGTERLAPQNYRQVSALYDFGPDGTSFTKPVTLILKVAVPRLVKPEDLTLAWYNKAEGKWVCIPAVVDLAHGQILAKVWHFSDFAVFAREVKKSFVDVASPVFSWAQKAIEILGGAGVVQGVDQIHFEPARAVTRAEFASLLVRALALPEKSETKSVFKDVQAGDWYAQAIMTAVDAGVVKGYEDGSFRPNNPVTREEAVTMLVRAMSLPGGESEKLAFTDSNDISTWAKTSVAAAAAEGLVKGFHNGTFRPQAVTARAESAVMIYRLLELE